MISRALKFLIMLTVASIVAGCKLAVIVPPGGAVKSSSMTRDCNGGTGGEFCTFDLSAVPLPFSESFTAIANSGYEFVKWQDGSGFQCADSTSATCLVTIADTQAGTTIRAAYEMGKIMPVFKELGTDTDGDGILNNSDPDDDNDGVLDGQDNCPLLGPNNDGFGCPLPVVAVDGKHWIKIYFGSSLTWAQINAVCPAGICNGMIEGFDVTGWRWAATAEVGDLISHYLSAAPSVAECNTFFAAFDSVEASTGFNNFRFRASSVSDNSTAILSVLLNTAPVLACTRYEFEPGDISGGIPTGGWFYHN